MPVTIIESDSFPTTLTAPQATEPASAPGLISQFLQGIANRSRWLYNRVHKLVDGGTFTLAAPLEFDGANVIVSSTLVAGGITASQPVSFGDALAVAGAVTCASTMSVTGAATVGGLLTATAGLNVVSSDLNVGGNCSAVNVYASAGGSFASTLQLGGATTFNSNGRVVPRTVINAGAASFSAAVATGSAYYSTSSADRNVTISSTGAQSGDVLEFFESANGFDLSVKNPGGTTLVVLSNTISGSPRSAQCRLIGSNWIVWDISNKP
jgi:hypothetical protein